MNSQIKIKITTTDGGCGVKIFAADTTVFSYAISELKEIIPVAFRSYEPAKKTWMITDWESLDDLVLEALENRQIKNLQTPIEK